MVAGKRAGSPDAVSTPDEKRLRTRGQLARKDADVALCIGNNQYET